MASLSEQICNAIDIIASKKVSTAAYDQTIKATILSCEDQDKGLYRLKYQDSTFEAYSLNPNTEYFQGYTVYVQLEEGDLSKKKIITGAVNNEGSISRSGEWIYL